MRLRNYFVIIFVIVAGLLIYFGFHTLSDRLLGVALFLLGMVHGHYRTTNKIEEQKMGEARKIDDKDNN